MSAMKKKTGIHFYINIKNYNEIIVDEENRTGKVTHALHALDTFFASIERYGKRKYPVSFLVEKITGSRLHMYVLDDLISAYQVVKDVSAYAYKLSKCINTEIGKYKTLKNFYLQVGVDYGKFYEFEFTGTDNYSEVTTIGYAANFAAKLQALASTGRIAISEEIYKVLDDCEKEKYVRVDDSNLKKYEQTCYYTCLLSQIASSSYNDEDSLKWAVNYANSLNLQDIDFTGVRKLLSFENLNKQHCKKIEGIPVFADVRGFTKQFSEDDSNLEEMAAKTQKILESMYIVSKEHGGVHVQFQGDREISLYHNVPGNYDVEYSPKYTCFKDAVLASMRLIDAVKPYQVHIGVGEHFGTLFATKLGAREEKDNILLGDTVIMADRMEDQCAGEDQIAITEEVYLGLKSEDSSLAGIFKRKDEYYVTTLSHQKYLQIISYKQQQSNTAKNNYNGAWGEG